MATLSNKLRSGDIPDIRCRKHTSSNIEYSFENFTFSLVNYCGTHDSGINFG